MTTRYTEHVLNCEGLACPMPIVRTKKTMEQLAPGQVLEVRATDRGSVADLQSWTQRTGHLYVGLKEEGGVLRHFLRKADAGEERTAEPFKRTMSNEELASKLNGTALAIQVLDVREPAEYAFGHIPGAVNVPLGELDAGMARLDKAQPYAVICRTGNRSDLACHRLSDAGFADLYNVMPGMSGWQGPVEGEQ